MEAHQHTHSAEAGRNIAVVFFLNAFFVIIELVGGVWTNSIAILSDALHDLGDCLSLGVAWFFQRKSTQQRDARYSYGYKRFSLLGAIFLSGVLTFSSIFVLTEAVRRIADPQSVHAQGMLWMALFGIAVNGAAALRLKHGESLNERAVFLHIMEDVLGWVAVLVVSVVMLFWQLPILDPLLSIGISLWVLWNVFRNLRGAFRILLQAVPDTIDTQQLKHSIEALPSVQSIHDLHIWTLDGVSHVMTLHLVTTDTDTEPIKTAVLEIARKLGIDHVTMETERPNRPCHHNCDQETT